MHNGKCNALTLLDLSATFDTINQTILMGRLSLWYCVSGVALTVLNVILLGDIRVKLGECLSSPLIISCRVALGPVLGMLFLYFAQLH